MASPSSASETKSRKERRKEERSAKKNRSKRAASSQPSVHIAETNAAAVVVTLEPHRKKSKLEKPVIPPLPPPPPNPNKDIPTNKKKKKPAKEEDPYAHFDPDTAAALRRDDEEIAALEGKLSSSSSSKNAKDRLKREYAKLECYGDDFGDFLDDLDTMVRRVVAGRSSDNDDENDDDDRAVRKYKALLEKDDSFEDEEESMGEDSMDASMEDSMGESEEEEEIVPMKEPAMEDLDEDDSVLDEMEAAEADLTTTRVVAEEEDSDYDSEENEESDDDQEKTEPDHDKGLTYRPSRGEDIYGNAVDLTESSNVGPKKYVPPHLRDKEKISNSSSSSSNDEMMEQARQESLRVVIQRSLNSALNRLSEETLVPVAQSISQLFSSHPTSHVNECIWKNTQNACIAPGQQMTGLIPVYVAALAGVHLQKGDSAQVAEFLIEKAVTELWTELKTAREIVTHDDGDSDNLDDPSVSKEVCNLALLLCYFYNFGLVHCTLLYDIIRNLIESCSEIDVEVLLLILSHCGRALRSDDPMALKEIVLMVQKNSLDKTKRSKISSSRSDYMVSAMMDLKNNKRRKQDQTFADKTSKLRKALGHIKTAIATSTKSQRSSDSSLRISLRDILDAETKGRWWKVGASWAGKHPHLSEESSSSSKEERKGNDEAVALPGGGSDSVMDQKLLVLAAKYRMNTDVRRTIFCIIMGSADYEDCFEKLVRAGMLKNRSERDTVRVLMECCGNEKAYNKFYSHLAARICEYQPQCKFTFQLAFWDSFKQFDEIQARKAANLAKLLFHLVAVHNCLKLSIIKDIDMAAPEDLSETAMIFLTIFLSSLLEHFDDPGDAFRLFDSGVGRKKGSASTANNNDAVEDDMGHMDDGEALQANLTVFLVQILKASPKYKKGSKFRANLKAAIKACDTANFF